jgi:gamma-glutamyltranspeptidase
MTFFHDILNPNRLAQTYFESNTTFPFTESNVKLDHNIVNNFVSVNDDSDLMVSYVGTLGSAWGSRIMTKNGFFLNNGLNLFSYSKSDSSNSVDSAKQPRGLLAPILTFNKKNPCIRRFAISYGHHGNMAGKSDDFGLTGFYYF